ncbi:2-amino-4-hydroxy-6-hydroxymethyldihydropteridine diphosphokinase [Ferrigenium kumadai]|uniref:2-amino-4-hydroxy-6-hydroxymethyldihydropteridine pyrophosphokinase n=1 Tax=Ferrigenium kumadai TaxID=1682490 RepID=A0AAN1W022_9PROT|nr:2-amino-4-hydroxy-6-hydroxymethyldihydropteridine diphosphokinase [Ferrigenium kumadai]BBI99965.1 2-amino-4-hydroxy-6-hydroxymethyldihydropteridine diphosphokinase [Ferrigenium kumadai]
MARAFIGIGSNIEPAKNVRAAIHSLARQTRLIGVSTVYCTDALERLEQPPYFNCVAEIETELSPVQVKHAMLRPIENELWRIRTQDKYAPRTIDLDLIVYGELAMDDGDLRLPDPDIFERPFLAIPLSELAPDLVLAGYGLRIGDIAAKLSLDGMRPLRDYSWLLKEDVSRRVK